VALSVPEVLGTVAFGVLVGVLSALLGVGGGIVMVPFMVLALGEPQKAAEGTSLLVIAPTAIAGVMAHRRAGLVAVREALLLGLGGALGSYAGARIALALRPDALEILFGGLVVVMGCRLIWQGSRVLSGRP
jgi:uncharacterized protein